MGLVVLSALGTRDIEEAFAASLDRFGRKRTERYFEHLDMELDRLAQGHRLTAVQISTVPGLFRYRVERHYVFFEPRKDGIFVSRILHTARFQARQLYPTQSAE